MSPVSKVVSKLGSQYEGRGFESHLFNMQRHLGGWLVVPGPAIQSSNLNDSINFPILTKVLEESYIKIGSSK